MSRRIASISLLTAWLCASGAMLDVAQVFAWARMFAGYARTESIAAAAAETFDPAKPCAICRAVSKARDGCERHGAAVPTAGPEKMVLVFESPSPFIAVSGRPAWPRMPAIETRVRSGDVPVPPPRGRAA
jgi:hypothetical protein